MIESASSLRALSLDDSLRSLSLLRAHRLLPRIEGTKPLMRDRVEVIKVLVQLVFHVRLHHVRDIVVRSKQVLSQRLRLDTKRKCLGLVVLQHRY